MYGFSSIISNNGETGIDVSGNPTIVNEANLSGLSFVGEGSLVTGYTSGSCDGFNFNNDWSVNCSGIPSEADEQAAANFYSTSNITSGFTQTFSNNNAVAIKGNGTFANTELFRFRSSTSKNRLIYEGAKSRKFHVAASLSVRVIGADGNFYGFLIAKNGEVVDDSDSVIRINNDTEIQSVSINTVISMNTDDYIEIYAQRLTGDGTDNLAVFSENLTVN